ncbi:DUF4446 family protein [Nocardiopsis codii]|uniref:DUF4446 family protein n=1 Tax=Nocardiopsis codii TaxID=3065942 RepID=UPI0038B417A5
MFTTIIASLGLVAGLGGLALGRYALTRARAIGDESQVLANRTAAVGASGVDPFAVRDVAVLHYDALEEMSGARSFSMALLNSAGDGVVLTSINGRTESRTYAKAVIRGEGDILLSPEEYRVVRSARLGDGVGAIVPAPAVPVDPIETAASTATVTGSAPGGTGTDTDSMVTVLESVEESEDEAETDDPPGDRAGDEAADADVDAVGDGVSREASDDSDEAGDGASGAIEEPGSDTSGDGVSGEDEEDSAPDAGPPVTRMRVTVESPKDTAGEGTSVRG